MADQVVQCGACRVDVGLTLQGGESLVRCPACSRTAPRDEAIRMARSSLIAIVMRDLTADLRAVIHADAKLGYQAAERYDWVLRGIHQGGEIGNNRFL